MLATQWGRPQPSMADPLIGLLAQASDRSGVNFYLWEAPAHMAVHGAQGEAEEACEVLGQHVSYKCVGRLLCCSTTYD